MGSRYVQCRMVSSSYEALVDALGTCCLVMAMGKDRLGHTKHQDGTVW